MNELIFPLAAVAITFLVAIPLLTLVSWWVLDIKRRRAESWASFGSESTFAWLVAPTLIPVLWLTSSAFHQNEPMQTLETCVVEHVQATTCFDAALLLGFLLGGMSLFIGIRAWRERPRELLNFVGMDHPASLRVARVIAGDSHLKSLRVDVVKHSGEPVYTIGLLRARVVLDACFVRDADDDMIHAALLHEHAHIEGADTLRGFIARLCLSANPLGALLVPNFERWRRAREAQCDSEAVHRGGDRLALAEGIVRALRFRCGGLSPQAMMLCGHDAAALKLRLALLMDEPPVPVRTLGHIALAIGVLAVLIAPHLGGSGALEHFHFEVEHLLRLH